jgi:hypothetical protein
MRELSQAERRARPPGWSVWVRRIAQGASYEETFGEGFRIGRDYGRKREQALELEIERLNRLAKEKRPGLIALEHRLEKTEERERALEEALKRIAGTIERDGYANAALAAVAEVASSALAASPGEPEGQPERIEWWDEPERNARYYRHIGCDEGDQHWIVPLDDCPAPTREDHECVRCALIVRLVARDIQSDHGPGEPSDALGLIARERERQISEEGWTPEHDDEHSLGELRMAARAYTGDPGRGKVAPLGWPWDPSAWKPSGDPARNLVKAGALIVAEIERLQRVQVGESNG